MDRLHENASSLKNMFFILFQGHPILFFISGFWIHLNMTCSNWQFWPPKQNTSKQKTNKKKDGLELQSGTVSNIYLLFVSSGVSVFCELFTPDTLEVRGEMGVNISVSTLQVSTHCLKVDWIFWKCAGYVLMPLKKKKSWCCETGFNFVSLGLVKKCTQHDETRLKTIRLSYHAWEKPTWECDLEQILLKMYWCF